MNPIIEYKASIFNPLNTLSVVQKRLSKRECRNYTDKAELLAFIDSVKAAPEVDGYMRIQCNCGKVFEYATKDEVPAADLTCDCGRKLIIYG